MSYFAQVAARLQSAHLWSCSPVRLVHGQPFHLKPAGTAIVFQVSGAEPSHTPHTADKLEQRGEVGEDSLQPGEVGAQAVCGQEGRAGAGAGIAEGCHSQDFLQRELMVPHQPTKHLLDTQDCVRL